MRHTLGFTDHGHHHVGLLRGVNGLVDHLLRRTRIDLHRLFILVEEGDDVVIAGDVGTFGINHFALVAQRIFNAGQHGH